MFVLRKLSHKAAESNPYVFYGLFIFIPDLCDCHSKKLIYFNQYLLLNVFFLIVKLELATSVLSSMYTWNRILELRKLQRKWLTIVGLLTLGEYSRKYGPYFQNYNKVEHTFSMMFMSQVLSLSTFGHLAKSISVEDV